MKRWAERPYRNSIESLTMQRSPANDTTIRSEFQGRMRAGTQGTKLLLCHSLLPKCPSASRHPNTSSQDPSPPSKETSSRPMPPNLYTALRIGVPKNAHAHLPVQGAPSHLQSAIPPEPRCRRLHLPNTPFPSFLRSSCSLTSRYGFIFLCYRLLMRPCCLVWGEECWGCQPFCAVVDEEYTYPRSAGSAND